MGNVSTSQSASVTKPVCYPTTCKAQGKSCNYIQDGCGASIYCGFCDGSETCGGTGIANVCGTPPSGQVTLSVSGRRDERVSSNPAGLSVRVGQTGTASFVSGTSVTLTASNSREAIPRTSPAAARRRTAGVGKGPASGGAATR